MSARAFYWRWVKGAFRAAVEPIDLLSGFVASVATIAGHFLQLGDRVMQDLAWQIPLFSVVTVLIVRLVTAPYRIWQEDQGVIAKLSQQSISQPVPSAHLTAMTRYEGTVENLQGMLAAQSALLRQRGRLVQAAEVQLQGRDNELVQQKREIDDLIFQLMNGFVVPLPHEPSSGLRIEVGWNEFIHIFDAPMRKPPKIRFHGLPDGVKPEAQSTALSCRVKFWPESISAASYASNVSIELDAEL